MKRFAQYFLRGLVVITPVALTVWVCWWVVSKVDSVVDVGVPGAGIIVTILGITVVGALASNLLTRGVVGLVDRLLARLPFVRLLYSSTKDLLNAFVGEQRRFNRPVRAQLDQAGHIWTLGFVTAEGAERLGMPGFVAVYLPQAYNFAGNLIIVPGNHVESVEGDAAEIMAFIVSGGVSGSAERSSRT
ncbi:MAG TPA: DUF502 domain-containing protein [Gemmatimonadales bacterium]|jgi:uncharacterized membrane protein|nr:DUF502 domain-containing protein [Gemmatimonadales bacterium]